MEKLKESNGGGGRVGNEKDITRQRFIRTFTVETISKYMCSSDKPHMHTCINAHVHRQI